LIKSVHVFIHSDILEPGISLVDLPGTGDNVESRAKVAEEYADLLDATMIVAPIIRASNDKAALNLLDGRRAKMMALSGSFNERQLGVVLSKMEDIDFDAYIRRSPEAYEDTSLIAAGHTVGGALARIKELKKERKISERSRASGERRMLSFKSKLRQKPKSPHVRKWERGLQEAKDAVKAASRNLHHITAQERGQCKVVKENQNYRAFWAMQTRNANVKERIQTDFVHRQEQLQASGPNAPAQVKEENGARAPALHVLPTSSRAYSALKGRGKPYLGIPAEMYTGVPALRQWVHRATAERREEHLDTMLSLYSSSMSGLDHWCQSQRTDHGLTMSTADAQSHLKPVHADFHAVS
jgi:hypothetical protein